MFGAPALVIEASFASLRLAASGSAKGTPGGLSEFKVARRGARAGTTSYSPSCFRMALAARPKLLLACKSASFRQEMGSLESATICLFRLAKFQSH